MKKNFMWLLMGLCALTFASCGSDDDNSGTQGGGTTGGVTLAQVVGTWELFHATGYQTVDGAAGHNWDEDTDPDWLIINANGTWEYQRYDTSSGNH